MRSVAFASILLALGIAGCGDPNAGALFADIQYATRCEMAATPHCGSPVNRDICGIDSGDPCTPDAPNPQLSCNIQESADGTRTLEFNASQGSGFALTIIQAIFAPGSTSAGGAGCRVVLVEGANRYSGACGASPPSEAQPCQITSVRFYDDEGNPTVEGALYCEGLQNTANPTLTIEVTQVGSGPGPAMTPGRFRLANCAGLTVPAE
ncbi:MAG TPA: hypothetical protein DEF51_29020 [Myxococcales bacterium]|nr:hypothetical protein [Myxococcales bacterium]